MFVLSLIVHGVVRKLFKFQPSHFEECSLCAKHSKCNQQGYFGTIVGSAESDGKSNSPFECFSASAPRFAEEDVADGDQRGTELRRAEPSHHKLHFSS